MTALFEHLNPMPYGDAQYMEVDLGIRVSVWRRHLDRAADSGLRLPAVWQQFPDAAVHVAWQSRQHVFEISPWVMPVQLC